MKAIPYNLRKNAAPIGWNAVNPGELPAVILTRFQLDLRRELFEAGAQTERELLMVHRNTQDAIMRVLKKMLDRAEEVMAGDAYPDRVSDRDLLILSYQLPLPLALALLRKRLIRGLALRDMAEAAHERTTAAGVLPSEADRLKSDRMAA